MTHRSVFVVIFLSALLAGCITVPRTPDAIRKAAQGGGPFTEKDMFEVKRPVSQVADTFRRKAGDCLNKKVTGTWWEGGVYRRQVRAYKPTVTAGKDRVELTLQSRVIEGSTSLGSPPADGWYMVVADAYSLDKNTTRVQLYKQAPGHSAVLPAIKNWASGTNMGCPDLTQ